MNSLAAVAFGMICSILGFILLIYRLVWICFKGSTWNNPPTVLSWAASWAIFGIVLLMVTVFTPDCENKCNRVDDLTLLSFIWGLTAVSYFPCAYACGRMGVVTGTDPDIPGKTETRMKLSGYDMVLILCGLAFFLGDTFAGKCPNKC